MTIVLSRRTSPGGSSAAGFLQQASLELTDAQIKTLPSTPVQLILAPGANKIIHIVGASVVTHPEAGAYGNMDSDTMLYLVLDPAGVFNAATIPCSGEALLGSTTGRTTLLLSDMFVDPVANVKLTSTSHSLAAAVNKPIAVGMDNPNGVPGVDLSGGNPANVLRVTVAYVVYDDVAEEFV